MRSIEITLPQHVQDIFIIEDTYSDFEWNINRFKEDKDFSPFSEASFVNRFLFRHSYKLKASKIWPNWLEGIDRYGKAFLSPLSIPTLPSISDLSSMLMSGYQVGPFTQSEINHYIATADINLYFSYYRSQSDYLYRVRDLISLNGLKFKKSRQYCRQIFKKYDIRIAKFTKEFKAQAIECTNIWRDQRPTNSSDGDFKETLEALDLAESGHIEGLCIFANSKLISFILYDLSVNKTIIALILKSSRDIKGVTDLTFHELCKHHMDIAILNTCQDLDISGLREKKLRLQPFSLSHKYMISNRTSEQTLSHENFVYYSKTHLKTKGNSSLQGIKSCPHRTYNNKHLLRIFPKLS